VNNKTRVDEEMDQATNLIGNLTNNVHINPVQSSLITHEVFLDMDIDEPHRYRNVISLLINVPAHDRIHFYINCNGGNLDSATAIINAMQICKAEITGHIMGACHSAASIIAMYCHSVHVFDTAYMMIHTASFGSIGSTQTVKAQTDFTVTQVEKLLDDCYDGFLSKEELKQVKQGIEMWYDAEEIQKRLKKRFAVMDAKSNKILLDFKPEKEKKAKATKK